MRRDAPASAPGLAAIAVFGDFALTAAQVVPFALPILIGVLYLNNVLFYWWGAAAVLLIAWILRPTIRFEGRELPADEAPRLHEEIAALKAKLRVPGRMQVHLDGSFNASAAETRGFFGLFGTRCVLTLGVPLLAALSREQVLAVIAHELGHFSRRHGRLGHWLYRARVGWIEYLQQVRHSDNALDQAATWFAKWFVPFFSERCFAHSRRCEYEADSDAATATGARSFAQALTWIAVIARFQDERFHRELEGWRAREAQPPRDYHERFARGARACAAHELRSWLDSALQEPPSTRDTHPSLAERLHALSQEAHLEIPQDSAGEILLGDAWTKVLTEFNELWVKEAGGDWRLEHLRTRHLVAPRVAPDDDAVREWSPDARLARAKALRHVDPPRGLAELTALHEANPAHGRIKFAYAAALLYEDDARGVALMETLARDEPAYRASAFVRIVDHFERLDDELQAERWGVSLDHVAEGMGNAVADCLKKAERGAGRVSSLHDAERSFLAEALRGEPCVGSAYLLESESQAYLSVDRPPVTVVTHTLALALDPAALSEKDEDERRLVARYQELLRGIVPPDHVALVRKHFTTEDLPEGFLQHSLVP